MNDEQQRLLASSAFRERVRGEIRWSEAWYDLDDAARERVFEETMLTRTLEAALDPQGLSGTSRAVLARIRGGS